MERANEKYGWVVMLALGILWLVVGLNQVFTPDALMENDALHIMGMSMNELEALSPEAVLYVRWLIGALGMLKMSWSFFVLAITMTGFRKGEKWAWYTLWLAPVLLVGQGIFNSVFLGDFNEMLQWIPITTITLFGLLHPYRNFFPKDRQEVLEEG
ncbi:MAG: hypothetical protein JSW05_00700 [Candidatus Thorarchaeota archaeon]|nr:MAG: hypothetical protein JSW05_00700 [Candidatus Thorarchaeota archaeon]